jgi:hypothetical protein
MEDKSKAAVATVLAVCFCIVVYQHFKPGTPAAPVTTTPVAEAARPSPVPVHPAKAGVPDEQATSMPHLSSDDVEAMHLDLEQRGHGAEDAPERRAPTTVSGPAGRLVREFFEDWLAGRYFEMGKLTTDPRGPNQFEANMKGSPIHIRSYEVLSANSTREGWEVKVAAELTSLASAHAACLINVRMTKGIHRRQPVFFFGPDFMKIERFKKTFGTIVVSRVQGILRIDVSNAKRPNIMQYVLDAPNLEPLDNPDPKDPHDMVSAEWAYNMAEALDIDRQDVPSLVFSSKPLYREGLKFMKAYTKRVKARMIEEGRTDYVDPLE